MRPKRFGDPLEAAEQLLAQSSPRRGAPARGPVIQARDQYLALWLIEKLGDSASRIERRLSMSQYPRRVDGSNGFSQPEMVARAARREGCLPKQVLEIADRSIPGFRAVHHSPLWHVLSHRRVGWQLPVYKPASYELEWVCAVGLDRHGLAGVWCESGTLTIFTPALIRRAGRLNSLAALSILLEVRLSALGFDLGKLAADHAADVFKRLEAGTAEYGSQCEHGGVPFRAVAAAISELANDLRSGYPLAQKAGLGLPTFRARPPTSFLDISRARKRR